MRMKRSRVGIGDQHRSDARRRQLWKAEDRASPRLLDRCIAGQDGLVSRWMNRRFEGMGPDVLLRCRDQLASDILSDVVSEAQDRTSRRASEKESRPAGT